MQKLTALATQPPMPIRQRRADLPETLANIIHQMLNMDPNRRMTSPIEVAKALQPFVANANLPALVARCTSTQPAAPRLADTPFDATVLTSESTPASPVLSPVRDTENGRLSNVGGRRTIRRWLMASAASCLAVLATVFYWPTAEGTVRIEINDPSIKVMIDNVGAEITQADKKPYRLRTGSHKLTIKHGEMEFDTKQFVLKNRSDEVTLKVELLPGKVQVSMGDAELDSRAIPKPVPPDQPQQPTKVAVAAVAKSSTPGPRPASGAADLDKPFILMREGRQFRDFKTGAGALAELQASDEIHIHGNGPFALPQIHLTGKGLVLRAAPGYRPRFVPSKSAAEQAGAPVHSPWIYVKDGPVILDGCEFQFVPAAGHMAIGDGGPWRITNCRLYQPDAQHTQGLIYYTGPKLHVSDSVLICGFSYGSFFLGKDVELELDNNIFWSSAFDHFNFNSKGAPKMLLTRNTFEGISIGIGLAADTDVTVRSDSNIFSHRRGGSLVRTHQTDRDAVKGQLHWNGNRNLYDLGVRFNPLACFVGYQADMVSTSFVGGELADWQKHWGDHERNALSANGPILLHQAAWLPDDANDPLPRLRHWVNRQLTTQLPVAKSTDVGPDWNIVGPGRGYVRALAAAGHPVAADQLMPEAGEEGPITLMRKGQPDRAHATLSAAMADAVHGDTVAINSSGMIAGIDRTNEKQGKRLTLRAGYGHRPSVEGLRLASGDVWSIEGLHFTADVTVIGAKAAAKETPQVPGSRLVNCSFPPDADWQRGSGPSVRILAELDDTATCEIVNCVLPNSLSLTARRLRIVNSAICGADHGNIETKWARQFDLERCAVYSAVSDVIASGTVAMSVTANHCWLEFASLRHGAEKVPFNWQGDHNVFCHGPQRWIGIDPEQKMVWDLNAWRSRWNSDAHSRSGDAAYVDPRFYSVLAESPAHAAGEGGTDLGADPTRFAEPLAVGTPAPASK